jgi:hypothetical protein
MATPGKSPLLYLGGYQMLSLAVVAFYLIHAPLGSAHSKGLIANASLRIEALVFMFAVFRQIRKDEQDRQVLAADE